MPSHFNWEKRVWMHPLVHDFAFGFGLSIDDNTKNCTIIPILFQDNAIVDYETIKTNKENADWSISSRPNCAAGSYVPKATVSWHAWCPSSEIDVMRFNTLDIHTSMLNRLDAFDKITGEDIEAILKLQHETTDEQAGALYNGTKLFEGHGVRDLHTDVPFLTTNGQLENVAFNVETYFDALHYYTNRQMLRKVSSNFKTFTVAGDLSKSVSIKDKIKRDIQGFVPSLCKYQHPYTFFGKLFIAPKVVKATQFQLPAETTLIEHLSVEGRVRFNEYNPDFNMSRA